MAVLVACPQCAVTLDVPESLLGQKVRCATCSTVFEAQRQQPPPLGAETPPAPATGVEDEDRH